MAPPLDRSRATTYFAARFGDPGARGGHTAPFTPGALGGGIRARPISVRDADVVETHRLPGMSIPNELWEGLEDMARDTSTSKTDLIRLAIERLLEPANREEELIIARRRIELLTAERNELLEAVQRLSAETETLHLTKQNLAARLAKAQRALDAIDAQVSAARSLAA